MARILVSLGITKIRLTGGEPLLRRGVVDFVRELRQLEPQGLKPIPLDWLVGTSGTRALPDASGRIVSDSSVRVVSDACGRVVPDDSTRAVSDASSCVVPNASKGIASASSKPGDADANELDIAITTNGHLLAEMAKPLKDAGLDRVTVSMDAVDPERFARITRVPGGFDHMLAGMRAARDAGLWPVKVNCVLMRGFNEDQIIPFGKFAREEGVTVRFIEFMPLEEGRVWAPDTVVTLDEILTRMAEYRPLVEIPHARSETARRYRFDDGIGEIGIIAPVSHPFCGHCSRIRITSDGKIRTCLFSVWDHDLHELMRRGASDDDIAGFIRGVVARKEERHHIGEPDFVPASRTMVHIGG